MPEAECCGSQASEFFRAVSHRPIVEINDSVWDRVADEFSDKGARDIVLLNRPEWTRNETPQPGGIARRMGIACDDARAENRQAFEAYPLNGFFFQPHDPHIANPAFRGASRCREQSKLRDTSGVTTTGKTTDDPDFERLQFLFAPLQAALTDANTGCPVGRNALRDHALRKPGHFCRELSRSRIQNHLPPARICAQSNRFAIDHHDFSAGRLRSQRAHHRSADLPRATDDQDAKHDVAPFIQPSHIGGCSVCSSAGVTGSGS